MATLNSHSEVSGHSEIKSVPLRCRLGFHHWHYFDSKILDGGRYLFDPWFYWSRKCIYCPKQYLDETYSLTGWFEISELMTWDKLSHDLKAGRLTMGTDLRTNSPDTNSRTSEAQSGAGEKGRL